MVEPFDQTSWSAGYGTQKITNSHAVPPRRLHRDATDPIDVTVRVVWATDGEEHVPGLAVAWTRDLVLIQLRDKRSRFLGVWFAAADVRRADP